MSARRALLVFAALYGFAASCRADEAKPSAPYEMIRSLQFLEDKITLGDATAQAAQPKLLAHIGEKFVAADAGVWQAPLNARAAVTYLFSGGRPSVVRTLLDRGSIPADFQKLTKGALAYAEGRDGDARALLDTIDPRSLPSYLGAHLALVQSMLSAGKDRKKGMQLLDVARLLAPGTLAEEAALRREIFVVADAGNVDRFLALSAQYALRFRNSVYAENFRQHFAASIMALGLARNVQQISKIDDVVRELSPQDQRKLYLSIARWAIVAGKTEIAAFAAEHAESLSKDGGHDEARSNLYLGASMIVTDQYDTGLARLEKVDTSRLSPSDAQLRDAALAVAKTVRKEIDETPSDPAAAAPPPAARPAPTGPNAAGDAKFPADIDAAEKALADVDRLLKEKKP